MSYTPRKYQQDAIDATIKKLLTDDNERGILSMCCGSGKTFVAYNIIKDFILRDKHIFVIVTSRVKLLTDMIEEFDKWFTQDHTHINIMAVGGSVTKKYINEIQKKNKSNNKITSNRSKNNTIFKTVVKSLTKKENIIIICTYNSSYQIAKELKGNDFKTHIDPNLVIFDEAHNTTGDYITSQTTYLLSGKHFCPDKYLFMTATPT